MKCQNSVIFIIFPAKPAEILSVCHKNQKFILLHKEFLLNDAVDTSTVHMLYNMDEVIYSIGYPLHMPYNIYIIYDILNSI